VIFFILRICWWVLLVWRVCNSVCHTNEVKLRRARLVLGLVTHLWRIPSQYSPRPTRPCRPSVGRCTPPLVKKWRVPCSCAPCYQDCWHRAKSVIGSNCRQLKAPLRGSAPLWNLWSMRESSHRRFFAAWFLCKFL